jgi:glycosyltransferase involved in cell wall biosynthesis
MHPETSIIIPTHGGRFLRAAVASVQAQTVWDWELIIIDDGSRDGTADVARELAASHPRIRVVSQPNSGVARARNRGLAEISKSSRYVAFVDHDDLWVPETLETLRGILIETPSASAAHGLTLTIDGEARPITFATNESSLPWNRMAVVDGRPQVWPLDVPTRFEVLAYDDCIVGMGSGLIRRTALDQVGGFDWRAEPADDYDMWVRLSRIGDIPFTHTVVMKYRWHEANSWPLYRSQRGRGSGYVRHKLVTSPENTPAQRRLAMTGYRAYERGRIAKRWTDIVAAVKCAKCRDVPRQSAALLLRIAAYVRGCPFQWQR